MVTRLYMLGECSSGLLEFVPRLEELPDDAEKVDLDAAFKASRLILADKDISQRSLDDLYRNGRSSGGARPKVNVKFDGELWIVKFPSSMDGDDAGARECQRPAARGCRHEEETSDA